jgi:hypothetical protein
MKEVPKKHLPEVSGGEVEPVGSNPKVPTPPTETDFPRNPFSPVYEAPYTIEE